jgi:hypothetical protein
MCSMFSMLGPTGRQCLHRLRLKDTLRLPAVAATGQSILEPRRPLPLDPVGRGARQLTIRLEHHYAARRGD